MTLSDEHFRDRGETEFLKEEAFARHAEFDADCALSPGFPTAAEEDKPPNLAEGLHVVVRGVLSHDYAPTLSKVFKAARCSLRALDSRACVYGS
jgi:hypothetical protein